MDLEAHKPREVRRPKGPFLILSTVAKMFHSNRIDPRAKKKRPVAQQHWRKKPEVHRGTLFSADGEIAQQRNSADSFLDSRLNFLTQCMNFKHGSGLISSSRSHGREVSADLLCHLRVLRRCTDTDVAAERLGSWLARLHNGAGCIKLLRELLSKSRRPVLHFDHGGADFPKAGFMTGPAQTHLYNCFPHKMTVYDNLGTRFGSQEASGLQTWQGFPGLK